MSLAALSRGWPAFPNTLLDPRLLTHDVVPCSQCRQVSWHPRDREQAIRQLVRPHEVSDLFRRVPRHEIPPGYTTAAGVAQWLKNQFYAGILRYIPDPAGVDIWCSPARTRNRGGGDCDDLAILGASMIRYPGCTAQVAIGSHCQGNVCQGHAWVEGRDEQGWFLLEGTNGALYRFRPSAYALRQLV